MTKIESPAEIQKRWKREGRTFRAREVNAEFQRQCEAAKTAREDAILANPERYSADLVGSIRDHRAAAAMRTERPKHWGYGDTSGIGIN